MEVCACLYSSIVSPHSFPSRIVRVSNLPAIASFHLRSHLRPIHRCGVITVRYKNYSAEVRCGKTSGVRTYSITCTPDDAAELTAAVGPFSSPSFSICSPSGELEMSHNHQSIARRGLKERKTMYRSLLYRTHATSQV